MAAGRSYEQVDDMTLADVEIIFAYWNKTPPANEILAAVYKVKPQSTARELSVEEIKAMRPPEGCMSIDELKEAFKRNGGLKLVG
jgi:hypothetical protein